MIVGREKIDALVEGGFETMDGEALPGGIVGVAMLVVEVKGDNDMTAFYTFCTDKREWIQRALVREASDAIEFSEAEVMGDE